MTFMFSDMKDFAKWLKRQAEALKKQADATRNVRQKAYANGQSGELMSLARMIDAGELVIGEPKKPKKEEEEPPPRPSAANDDFLAWVKGHYSTRIYMGACNLVEKGNSEEEVRRWISLGALLIKGQAETNDQTVQVPEEGRATDKAV